MEKKFAFTPNLFMRCIYNVLIAHGCTQNPALNIDYFKIDEESYEKLIGTEFEIRAVPSFGGSEGIYLDIYLEGRDYFEGAPAAQKVKINMATAKTLDDSLQSMEAMGILAADIIWYGNKIANKYVDAFAPDYQNPMCVTISDPGRGSVPMPMHAKMCDSFQKAYPFLKNPQYDGYTFYGKKDAAILLTLSELEPYDEISKAVKDGRLIGLRADSTHVTVWEPMMLNDPDLVLFALLPEADELDLGKSLYLSYDKLDNLLQKWATEYFGNDVHASVGVEKPGEMPSIYLENLSEAHADKYKALYDQYEQMDEFSYSHVEYGFDLPSDASLGLFSEILASLGMNSVGIAIGKSNGVIFIEKSI